MTVKLARDGALTIIVRAHLPIWIIWRVERFQKLQENVVLGVFSVDVLFMKLKKRRSALSDLTRFGKVIN